MPRSNHDFCPACGDVGEVKVIKNIAQIGPYHLGKESWEKCNFCSEISVSRLDKDNELKLLEEGLKDSKKLTTHQRDILVPLIKEKFMTRQRQAQYELKAMQSQTKDEQ